MVRAIFIYLIVILVVTGLTILFVGWDVWRGTMQSFVFPPLYGFGT